MTRPISSIELMMFRSRCCHERVLRAETAAAARRQVVRFFRQLAIAYRQRRQLAAVARLDDRTLRDIGLSRAELQAAARQPLWAFKPTVLRRRDNAGDRGLDGLVRLDDGKGPGLGETRQRLRHEHFHAKVG